METENLLTNTTLVTVETFYRVTVWRADRIGAPLAEWERFAPNVPTLIETTRRVAEKEFSQPVALDINPA